MRGLKILVTAMGVLLVVGFAALVATIAVRLSHRAPAPAVAFTAPPVTLPPGANIERLSTGPDRIVLAIALPDGTKQLLVIDLQTGRLLGTIPLAEH
jgi:Family of unknown function (DUF6476)